ncbi:glutaredoxin family protein [Azonexus hydrophilus]|uniref:Glutaredoxin family protein n=1 Tax=Azonexus hydrophilus TaxID=418702 RepID=A0ABZ2XGG1_9RHOO|nr:glutaredoxin family protein [Azonexus hydrophilus]
MQRLLVLCLALCCGLAQAQTYRWTDANGRTIVSDTPPPGQARNVAKAGGKAQPDDGLPFATRLAAEKHPVLLYTAAECVAECQQARELLKTRNIPYSEKMVKTPEEFDELKRLIGDVFVPTMKVGREFHRGFSRTAYDNLLDLAGYPKAAGGKP